MNFSLNAAFARLFFCGNLKIWNKHIKVTHDYTGEHEGFAYLVVDTKIKNGEAYEEYKLRAKPIVESFGGEYLARGGNTTAPEKIVDTYWP